MSLYNLVKIRKLPVLFTSLFTSVYQVLYLRPKNSPQLLWHNFNDFMEKVLCTKFCDVLVSSEEVMKLQNVESVMNDIIPANVQNNLSLVFLSYFC